MSVHPWAAGAVSSGKEQISSYGFTSEEIDSLSLLATIIEQSSLALSRHGAPEAALLADSLVLMRDLSNNGN